MSCVACERLHSPFRNSWNQPKCAPCEAVDLVATLNGPAPNGGFRTPYRMAFAVGTLVLDKVWYVGRGSRGDYYVHGVTDGVHQWCLSFDQYVADALDRMGLVGSAS